MMARILKKIESKGRAHDHPEEVVLSFGKYKGKLIKQVDDGYLRWVQATVESCWWRNLASEVLERRQKSGTKSRDVFLAELKACRDLEKGKQLHAEALDTGNDSCIYVATALVNVYVKCGSMVDARRVFDGIKRPNVVSWTTIISGYAKSGDGGTALDLFAKMRSQGCAPNSRTFIAALRACTSLASKQGRGGRTVCRELGKQIHVDIGCYADAYLQNSLVNMYAKCGSMVDARQVFDNIKHPDTVSWTALILGYAENGEGITALDLFGRMRSQGCVPDSITFVAALKACTSLALGQHGSGKVDCKEQGKKIHLEAGYQLDIYVQNTLIDMYAKCGCMTDAREVFDGIKHPDMVSWNTLILGYAENRDGITALDLFSKMKFEGWTPDSITYVAALKACISLTLEHDGSGRKECKNRGKVIHLEIAYHLENQVQGVQSTLIDMYAKCGDIIDARQVFDGIQHPDVVSWNALILGYVENGDAVTALDLFARMGSQGCAPESITYVAALKACSLIGALEWGRAIHAKIHASIDIGTEPILITCLVDLYAKCGSLVEAQDVFNSHPKTRKLSTWNALLAGYSRLADCKVFEIFEGMQDAGFPPDGITFLAILTCCNHAGLISKGNEFLEAMSTIYGITPSVLHYTCMVDILGRSNKMEDAVALLQSMPCRPNAVSWMAILDANRKWKNIEIARCI